MGLNGGDQLVIIDLLEPLHSSSSITTDEHPHLQIDIPLPTAEEPEHTTLPLGGAPATPSNTIPKTPWKPRITLLAEVTDLLDQGMANDYNRESEHSMMGEEVAMEVDLPQPQKAEFLMPPLDTSSQGSVERRWILPWRVTPLTFILPWLHVAAIVPVQWSFRKI